jgi:hypothetical protein
LGVRIAEKEAWFTNCINGEAQGETKWNQNIPQPVVQCQKLSGQARGAIPQDKDMKRLSI